MILTADSSLDNESVELSLLLDDLFHLHHLNFRDYSPASLKRRVLQRVANENTRTIAGLRELVLSDAASMERLITSLTIHVTAMFRDPGFFLTFRREIVPILKTYPFLRIWVAGCSTGEEVYSLAILLHEEGLYDRARIYATDLSERAIQRARNRIYPLTAMQEYTRNYQKAGGQCSFAEYYTADYQSAIFRPFLKENVIFAPHNLSGDSSFNEFHLIFCRNVMIYFNRELQSRVHTLLNQSLMTLGYLGLGRSESLRFSVIEDFFIAVSRQERLYRKIK
jgi:chemotaxis protein methyltransferase CheR